jgi:hypothetical protein
VIVEYKKINEQSDYSDGCIEITATNAKDAFKIGRMFGEMESQCIESVMSRDSGLDEVSIRVPLRFREEK